MAILGPDFGGLPFRSQMSAGSAPRRFCDLGDAVRVVADRLRRLNRCVSGSGLSCIVDGHFPILDPFGDAERVVEALLSTLLHCRYSMTPDMPGRSGGLSPLYLEVLSFVDARGVRQARLMMVVQSPCAASLAQLARGHLIETSLPERIDALRGVLQISDLGSRMIVRLDFPQQHPVEAAL